MRLRCFCELLQRQARVLTRAGTVHLLAVSLHHSESSPGGSRHCRWHVRLRICACICKNPRCALHAALDQRWGSGDPASLHSAVHIACRLRADSRFRNTNKHQRQKPHSVQMSPSTRSTSCGCWECCVSTVAFPGHHTKCGK